MVKRGLALCLLLGMASVAQAGGVVTLEPRTPGPYAQGDEIIVDIFMAQELGGADRDLRFVQLDFNASNPDVALYVTRTHDLPGTDIRFWNFLGVPNCPASDTATCGAGHYIEDSMGGARAKVLSTAYYFTDSANLALNTNAQRRLLADGTPLKLGEFVAQMPMADDCYEINALNAAEGNPDIGGADVRFGFGVDVGGIPITVWRAQTGEITGDVLEMCVGEPPPCVNLTSAFPGCDVSVPRVSNNVIKLTFDGAIPALPGSPPVEIRPLLAGGATGGDIAAGFTYSIEGGNVLRIQETGQAFSNETWYAVTSGWAELCDFKVDFRVIYGDVDSSGRTTGTDANAVWAARSNTPPDGSIYDMDGGGTITGTDANAAWAKRDSQDPGKPAGHTCTP